MQAQTQIPQLLQQAITKHRAGDLGGAAQLYQQILALDPQHADALQLLGVIAQQIGNAELARQLLEQAVTFAPRHAVALSNLSILLRAAGDLPGALARAEAAVAADSKSAEAYSALGGVRAAQQDFAGALAAYENARVLQPDNALLLNDSANMQRRLGQLDQAYATITRALALAPQLAILSHTRGNILRSAGYVDLALQAFDAAARLEPTLTDSKQNAALCALLLGDYDQGWRRYAVRGTVDARYGGLQLWDGHAPVPLLLHAEQGLGDTLQFIRYAPQVAARVPHLVVEVQQPLLRLLQENYPSLHFITPDMPVPAGLQARCRLLDSAQWFTPTGAAYLKAGAATTAMQALVFNVAAPRFGLVWAGNPGHLNDANRSVDYGLLMQALQPHAAHGIALQKGEGAMRVMQQSTRPLPDGGALCSDFIDTAALIGALDLVITVDTSVAHLAGALGKPVWLLLPFDPDWRWQLQRQDTIWYGAMKLYRQEAPQDWTGVLKRLADDLRRFVAGDKTVLQPEPWHGAPARRATQPVPGLAV